MIRLHTVKAVFKRDFFAYFISPTGYVFISLFVIISAYANFARDDGSFFAANLANLDSLNEMMPYLLLIFVPAITMNVWAEERKQGTDQLLLTLPAYDVDIVLGKYLAAVGIFSVSLAFSFSNVILIAFLGDPDWGLMFGTYFGYWLMGAALAAAGMLGSLLSANATVGFILGSLLCSLFVIPMSMISLGSVLSFVSFGLIQVSINLEAWGIPAMFERFGDGLVTPEGVLYFLFITTVMLYLNMVLIGKRQWASVRRATLGLHFALRAIALTTIGVASVILVGYRDIRADITAERLHSLSSYSQELVAGLERPVNIEAFVGENVPGDYIQAKKDLLLRLDGLGAASKGKVSVKVHRTEPYTELATLAEENYRIRFPQDFRTADAQWPVNQTFFLSVVVSSGSMQEVLPFFYKDLSIEYELVRSIRIVAQAKRKKIGILKTDPNLSIVGSFDFILKQPKHEWEIVKELRRQYEVVEVLPGGAYPSDIDALIALQPTLLPQEQMDRLADHMLAGKATLLVVDPLPRLMGTMGFAPMLNKRDPRDPDAGSDKGDIEGFLRIAGMRLNVETLIWDGYNPHPGTLKDFGQEALIFTGQDKERAFNPEHQAVAGLQEILNFYSGHVEDISAQTGTTFTPLLRTGPNGGLLRWDDVLQHDLFRGGYVPRKPSHYPLGSGEYVIAAHATGPMDPTRIQPGVIKDAGEVTTTPVEGRPQANFIVIADMDMIADDFVLIRRDNADFLDLDNITFFLNCIDVLAGDTTLVDIRKRRKQHRTLTKLETAHELFKEQARHSEEAADQRAKDALDAAQKQLEDKVAAIDARTDLDWKAKEDAKKRVQRVEQERFNQTKKRIEAEKENEQNNIKKSMKSKQRATERLYTWLAVLLPPIPAVLMGVFFFFYRVNRERESVYEKRLL